MRRCSLILVLLSLFVFVSACGGSSGGVPDDEQTAPVLRSGEAGGVAVTVMFNPVSPSIVDVTFDTHTVDLSFDVAATSTLTVDDGRAWTGVWEGDEPGGHHLKGSLAFPVVPISGETMTLTFGGLPESITLTWTVP